MKLCLPLLLAVAMLKVEAYPSMDKIVEEAKLQQIIDAIIEGDQLDIQADKSPDNNDMEDPETLSGVIQENMEIEGDDNYPETVPGMIQQNMEIEGDDDDSEAESDDIAVENGAGECA